LYYVSEVQEKNIALNHILVHSALGMEIFVQKEEVGRPSRATLTRAASRVPIAVSISMSQGLRHVAPCVMKTLVLKVTVGMIIYILA